MTPFYEKARNLWQKMQDKQIQKGLLKYPEPFNPHSWSSQELLEHALEESVDLVHYLVGLKEKLDKLEQENQNLKEELKLVRRINRIAKPSPFEEQCLKPPYADIDD